MRQLLMQLTQSMSQYHKPFNPLSFQLYLLIFPHYDFLFSQSGMCIVNYLPSTATNLQGQVGSHKTNYVNCQSYVNSLLQTGL